jgi:hypothetical protein
VTTVERAVRRALVASAAALLLAGCGGHDAPVAAAADATHHRPAAPGAVAAHAAAGRSARSAPTATPKRVSAVHRAGGSAAAPSHGSAVSQAAVAVSTLLLDRTDLGTDWDDLPGDSSSEPHRYCGAVFASDRAIVDRAYRSVVRHTDGLRVEQETLRYSGAGAAAAMSDFRAAMRCAAYTSGSGADSVEIQPAPSDWLPAGADERVGGTVTFTKGDLVLHSRLGVYRSGSYVDVVSIAFHDDSTLEGQAPGIARAALRAAGWA